MGRLVKRFFVLVVLSTTATATRCGAGEHYQDTSFPCNADPKQFKIGSPTRTQQNSRGESSGKWFDQCRGHNGANSDYKSPATGMHTCVEMDKNVCGPGINKGSGMTKLAEGKEFCESMNAWLCTQEELTMPCVERTGCDYNYTWIWSSQSCVPDQAHFPGKTMCHLAAP